MVENQRLPCNPTYIYVLHDCDHLNENYFECLYFTYFIQRVDKKVLKIPKYGCLILL